MPAQLASWAAASDARLVHVSTDLVFGGEDAPAGGFDEDAPVIDFLGEINAKICERAKEHPDFTGESPTKKLRKSGQHCDLLTRDEVIALRLYTGAAGAAGAAGGSIYI